MLTKLLAEFNSYRRPLSSRELAGMFDKDQAVIEGMLETLVRSGRLVELGLDGGCHQCPEQRFCLVLPLEGRRFCLASHEKTNLPAEQETGRDADD